MQSFIFKHIPVTCYFEIMKMKIMYAFGDLDLKMKHRDDLIFMLNNIQ